jgi:hypothetical protein
MLGGRVWFCQWSVAPLRLGFPGSVGDVEATVLQRNNFSQLLPFSNGDLLRCQRRGWGDLSRSRVGASLSSSRDDVVDPVNLKEDDLWKKSEHCSGCPWWKRRMRRGY